MAPKKILVSAKWKDQFTKLQVEVLKIYRNRHINTKHKLETPPVCYINKELK